MVGTEAWVKVPGLAHAEGMAHEITQIERMIARKIFVVDTGWKHKTWENKPGPEFA